MGVKRCKLAKKTQRKLLEFFVLEVTARAAADLLGLQAKTTKLFYRKFRALNAEKLEAAASEVAGEIE
jgi:transposase